jgi:outer membrane protein TolC
MELYRVLIAVGLLAALSPSVKAASAEVLGVQDYLRQAREGHQGYRASVEASQGSSLRSGDAELLVAPTLFGEVSIGTDRRETQTPAFQGTRSNRNAYKFGLRQQFKFGLQASLYYDYSRTQVWDVGTMFLPVNPWSEARLILELAQPLLKNGLGREIRAQLEAAEAQALATGFSQSFSGKLIMADAEGAYWRLVLARDSVRVAKESLDRQQKLKDWNAGRVKMQLADRADLLQSDAAVEARRLELRNAEDEERAASRAFNTLRGREEDQVSDRLQNIAGSEMDKLVAPVRAQFREDTLATEQQQRALAASARLGKEKNLPQLDVFTQLSTNGRDATLGGATSESLTATRPAGAVGLRFSVPLDFEATADSRQGYVREREAANMNFERKKYEQEREWTDLSRKLDESKARLKLARTFEEAQREKLTYERDRQRRGRTTTFQVLMFEQDYAVAQLNHIRAQADVLRILTQMKTFAPGGAS